MKKILLAYLLLMSVAASATEVLRFVVPFGVGGPNDLIARQVQRDLTRELNLTVVIENKTGAGGDIGTQAVLNATPNESVLLSQASGIVINSIIKKQNFDVEKLIPIVNLGTSPLVIVVRSDSRLKTVGLWQQLDDRAITSNSHGGIGTITFLCGKLFQQEIKKNIVQVPFKGGQVEQVLSVLNGTVDSACVFANAVMPYIEQKKLWPVAVISPTRLAELPNTPTVRELGMPKLDFQPSLALLFMNPGADPELKKQIQSTMVKILSDKETRKPYENLGLTILKNPILPDNFIETQKRIYSRLLQNIDLDQ